MRAEARAGRFWLLLAMLVVLVAISAPATSGHPAAGHRSSLSGGTVSAAPSVYDELHDRPRGSVTAGHTSTTAVPDTWWVVHHGAPGGCALTARGPAGDMGRAAAPSSVSTSRSSRAPPRM